jgi:hypothetical protein
MLMILFLWLVYQWSAPVNISNTPPAGVNGSNYPALAFDYGHTLHFVWSECYGSATDLPDIFYTKQVNDTFTTHLNISQTPSISFVPKIIINKDNQIYIFWCEWISDAEAYIFWRKKIGGILTPTDTLSKDTPGVAGSIEVAIDTLNRIHAVWDQHVISRKYTNIFYCCYSEGAWSSPIKLNTKPGAMNPDIAIDSKQHLHVVWQQVQIDSSGGGYVELRDIFHRNYDGENWSVIDNISNLPHSASCTPEIAVDECGYLYVVWEEHGITGLVGPDYSCWFSFSDGEDWSQPQIFEDTDGHYPYVAANKNGVGCIGWTSSAVEAKFFCNSRFTESSNIINDDGIIHQLTITDCDTVYAVFGRRMSELYNDTEVFYAKCALPDFPTLPDNHSAYLTFLGKANIPYRLPEDGIVIFELYDALGRLVKKVDLGYKPAGSYIKPVSLTSFKGASGVYFYHIYTQTSETKGKLALPK